MSSALRMSWWPSSRRPRSCLPLIADGAETTSQQRLHARTLALPHQPKRHPPEGWAVRRRHTAILAAVATTVAVALHLSPLLIATHSQPRLRPGHLDGYRRVHFCEGF